VAVLLDDGHGPGFVPHAGRQGNLDTIRGRPPSTPFNFAVMLCYPR
jgi:hypothetical protein